MGTSQAFTVTTRFQTDHIERFYVQNGKRIGLPTLYVRNPGADGVYGPMQGPKITDEYCGLTYDSWDGPASHMLRNSRNGMVLSMSAWYDQETYSNGQPSGGASTGMSWLDGVNVWGEHPTKTGPCSTTTQDSGHHSTTFSKIKFGDIGTTVPNLPPAPAPTPPPAPPPAPTPSGPGQCCHGGCGQSCSVGDWCAQNRDNCENHCSGQFCTAPSPAPTPPAPGPSCDCGWVDQYGCHGSDGSFCYDQCCGAPTPDCDCGWVNQYGCHGSDGSMCYGVCCGSEVSV